jgi:hypothetical protein
MLDWIREHIPARFRIFGWCQDVGEAEHPGQVSKLQLLLSQRETLKNFFDYIVLTFVTFQSLGITFHHSVGRTATDGASFVDNFRWSTQLLNRITASSGNLRVLSSTELIFLKSVFLPMYAALIFMSFSHTGGWMLGLIVVAQLPVVLGWFINAMVFQGVDYMPAFVVINMCGIIGCVYFVSLMRTLTLQAFRLTQKLALVACWLAGFPSSVFVLYFATFVGVEESSLTYARERTAQTRGAALLCSFAWLISVTVLTDTYAFPWMSRSHPGDYFISTAVGVILALTAVVWLVFEILASSRGAKFVDGALRLFSRSYIKLAHTLILPALDNFFDNDRVAVLTLFSSSKRWPFGGYYFFLWVASILLPVLYTVVFVIQAVWIRNNTNAFVYRWFVSETDSVPGDLCAPYKNRFAFWAVVDVVHSVLYALFAGLEYFGANIVLNITMATFDILFRPHLFTSRSILDAGNRIVLVVGDIVAAVYAGNDTKAVPGALAPILIVLLLAPLVAAIVWYFINEFSEEKRRAIINASLVIELSASDAEQHNIDLRELSSTSVYSSDFESSGGTLFFGSGSDDEDGRGGRKEEAEDEGAEFLPEIEIIGPPLVNRPKALALSDDSISDMEIPRLPPLPERRVEAEDFKAEFMEIPLPTPPRTVARPLPEVKRVPRPIEHDAPAGGQMKKIRKVLEMARQMRYKYTESEAGRVRYDAALVERFRSSREADEFTEQTDDLAKTVLYFAFTVIFFIGVFVATHAWSLFGIDTLSVYEYPASYETFDYD